MDEIRYAQSFEGYVQRDMEPSEAHSTGACSKCGGLLEAEACRLFLTSPAVLHGEDDEAEHVADDIKERNLLFVRCALDEALPMDNAAPLFRKLDSLGDCCAVRKYVCMNTDHAFNDSKNLMAKVVTEWLAEIAK